MPRKFTDNEDVDSAGVYLVTVEDFEWRPRDKADQTDKANAPQEVSPKPSDDDAVPTKPQQGKEGDSG